MREIINHKTVRETTHLTTHDDSEDVETSTIEEAVVSLLGEAITAETITTDSLTQTKQESSNDGPFALTNYSREVCYICG